MSVFFFDKVIWSRIFHHLPIEQVKEWALLSKSMYHASRLGSAMNVRWKIESVTILNALSKSFFVHLIQAVELNQCSILTSLYFINVKITNVKLQINRDNLIYSRNEFIDFDRITHLSFNLKPKVSKIQISDLPPGLKSLTFVGSHSCTVLIPPILPESLEHLWIEKCKIANLNLPSGLKELFYEDKDFFRNVPTIPTNIRKLQVFGDCASNGWRIFDKDIVYPNLEHVEVIRNNSARDKSTTFYTKGLPALKYVEGTKLTIVNDGKLYMRHAYPYADQIDISVYHFGEEEEEERSVKKIKL